MRIAITGRFENSYFSGAITQVAIALSRALTTAGHTVELLAPPKEALWFIDCKDHAANVPSRKNYNLSEIINPYDLLVEVVWNVPAQDRPKVAKKTILFAHYPPLFHDMESSVYQFNPAKREFTNLHGIWTWDHYQSDDVRYLEFLSGVNVSKLPFVWDSHPLDVYEKESNLPPWSESAKQIEHKLPVGAPSTLAWCLRITESNMSNSSSAVLPINIVSAIRGKGDDVRWMIHNGDGIAQSDFFKSNIVKNCNLGTDISGSFVGRLRLPDMRRDKTVLVAHQRWRPLKATLLDALYLGIPMIHNCHIAKAMGGSYYYELNQIQDAQEAWIRLKTDAESEKGFFHPNAAAIRKKALQGRFGPSTPSVQEALQAAIQQLKTAVPMVRALSTPTSTLKIAFVDMWENFQPDYNFFYHLLSWAGVNHNFTVEVTKTDPNLILYGPFGTEHQAESWKSIPKIFYTGENSPARNDYNTMLNIGFEYPKQGGTPYIRVPLWMTEINWFRKDPAKFVNPIPVELEECVIATPSKWDRFCSFVATNPGNPLRNAAFQIINQYKPIEAAGRLFCNRVEGPLPAGAGGGGGERIKVDYYKHSKFVLAFENSSSPGYCTEKLFHAKVAGAIPIYWGDPLVMNDFDEAGFFHAGKCGNGEDLLKQVKELDMDEARCKAMQAIPALSANKRKECEATMGILVKAFCAIGLRKDITVKEEEWNIQAVTPAVTPVAIPPSLTIRPVPQKQCFVTAANAKYIDSAKMLLDSVNDVPKVLYVWSDVSKESITSLTDVEVRILPTDQQPWEGFWDPQHFAWKLWVLHDAGTKAEPDTNILYLDAGVFVASSIDKIWNQIEEQHVFLLDDEEQTNERWCHPEFCSAMSTTPAELQEHQITGGLIGYKVGGQYQSKLVEAALQIAKTQPNTIKGEKWKPYGGVCFGHRHDQSILSILSTRCKAPRLPLKDFYCDHSLKRALAWGTPLYVHRGQFKPFVPLLPEIGEAFLINLDRRPDRLKKFKESHPTLSKQTYKWRATDGTTLKLTPQIAHLFRENDFKWKKAVIGCAISHMGLWERCANDSNGHNYLILEDDVRFQAGWEAKWTEASKQIPADADVIYLGGILPPNKPALPHITEQINPFFAKVAKNNVMSGGPPRRYFHFCNYSYILTQQGARKLITLIKEKGIFTSGDHMIVNHGDSLLNIYFTTPMMAGCFQDDDPVYQTSAFNDFSRKDTFDSDLWNNNEHFSQDEVVTQMAALMQPLLTPVIQPVVEESSTTGISVYAIPGTGIDYEKQWLEDMFQSTLSIKSIQTVLPKNSILLMQRTPPTFQQGRYKEILDAQEPNSILLLHMSDEDGYDPILLYNHPSVKHVIRNYYRKDCIDVSKITVLPLGYSAKAPISTPTFTDRSLMWSFAGSMDRPGREEALKPLEALTPFEKQIKATFGDPSPLKGSAYTDQLLKTKFIPAVKGFWALESFRLYEALEAGCIPLYVPSEGSNGDEYTTVLGKSPILALPSWTQAPNLLEQLSKNPSVMEQHRQDLQTWWKEKKQALQTALSTILSR
jgi:GR25 family glycosyltransferase involved in LPS biosynthesis